MRLLEPRVGLGPTLRAMTILGAALTSTSVAAQNQVDAPPLQWMAWTWQTAAFFGFILLCLLTLSAWEYLKPGGDPRSPGALGINTTRGDRLFISLLTAAYVHLAWLGLVSAPLWGATLIAIILALAIFRWA